jgi:hypothetical protein
VQDGGLALVKYFILAAHYARKQGMQALESTLAVQPHPCDGEGKKNEHELRGLGISNSAVERADADTSREHHPLNTQVVLHECFNLCRGASQILLRPDDVKAWMDKDCQNALDSSRPGLPNQSGTIRFVRRSSSITYTSP